MFDDLRILRENREGLERKPDDDAPVGADLRHEHGALFRATATLKTLVDAERPYHDRVDLPAYMLFSAADPRATLATRAGTEWLFWYGDDGWKLGFAQTPRGRRPAEPRTPTNRVIRREAPVRLTQCRPGRNSMNIKVFQIHSGRSNNNFGLPGVLPLTARRPCAAMGS